MSKQIRINEQAYKCLKRLAKKHKKPISDCASGVVEVFESLLEEIENDGTLVIEGPNKERREPMFALFKKRTRRR